MPKRKKRSSSDESAPRRRRSMKPRVNRQIKTLLSVALFLFLLASVFDMAGALGGTVHRFLKVTVGGLTPLYAVLLIWIALRVFFPGKLRPRFYALLGGLLFVVTLAGIMHSFAKGEPLGVAQAGDGGGMLGYIAYGVLLAAFGELIGKLILFILLSVAIMLILDTAIVPYLHQESEEGDEKEGADDTKVKVMELNQEKKKPSFNPFKRGVPSPAVVKVEPMRPLMVKPSGHPLTNWNYPPTSLLDQVDMKPQAGNIQKRIETIEKALRDFGIDVKMMEVHIGPTVTQYTLKPAEGVKLNQITARQDDLALALSAQSLRVEAPIPGKGLVGVEIPNDKKAIVGMRDLLEDKRFKQVGSKLSIVLGRDVSGEPAIADLGRMPHLLIAGATGSGKSVCINAVILSLLFNNSPDELRMILVDPKRVELTAYNGLPHLLTPVITESQDTVRALAYCVKEMERRYKLFAATGRKNIEYYNQEPDPHEGRLPYIVLIIDELADLMMAAAREVEGSIVRLAQMARAVGIHLIIATQRPSVDVITGLIKANIPTRIAFAVASQIDSRTILDMAGAEKLLGYGDMLYISTEFGKPKRIQGVYATEKDISTVIAHIKMQEAGDRYVAAVLETRVETRLGGSRDGGDIDDNLFQEAYEVVKQAGKASTTLLQTRLSVGYARAARLMQAMEDRGLIGPAKGAKPREVYGVTPADDLEEEDNVDGFGESA